MPVLQLKGSSVIDSYHNPVPHCRQEFDEDLSLPKREKPSLDGNLIIEGDKVRCAPEE